MKPIARRDFLRQSACAAASIAALSFSEDALARQPAITFPTAPRDRLSVTSWPFRADIESPTNRYRDSKKPGLDLKDFAAMVAEKFGVHNINPLSWHFSSTSPAYLDAFRKGIEKAGSHLVGLGLGGGAFYDPDRSKRQKAVDSARKWIDIAVIVGSPSVRPQIDEPRRIAPSVDHAAESYGKLAGYGARKNIVVNMENDDPVTQDPFFIARIIEKVDNPYLRSLPDFGNSDVKGAAFNEKAMKTMFRHAYNMSHVKDMIQDDHGKVFKVNLEQIFGIAKSSGYRGYFSMEYDTDFGDPYAGTKRLIEESLRCL
ncbi:MAG TPA: TIM barrel protein [Terriglobia bacterium]|nr:TIM barrel protein [Terriglobia bacterium]